ncbi:MAG: plastocyanin/azurin family copper-binding protein, partial [Verrucomicrobiota bacterium]
FEMARTVSRAITLEPMAAQDGKAVAALSRLLLIQPASELTAGRARLDALASGQASDLVRQSARAALIVADGSLDAAWAEAVKSPVRLTELLNALALVPDPALRASAYEKVIPLLSALPPALEAMLREKTASMGRYIRIELPRKGTLTLAEVEVFSDGKNIAARGEARQSTTSHGGEAKRAIDGNTNGAYGSGSQTHSAENQDHPWWELDLKKEQPIEAITIWNRTESEGIYLSRLDRFDLTVLDSNRREVFRKTANPAPKISSRFEFAGDPAGALRRAAIRAAASTGREPGALFATLVELIRKNEEPGAAAQAILQLPRSAWDKALAEVAVDALTQWAGGVPATSRTSQDYIETVQVASELASLLPPEKASVSRKNLRNLGVNVYVIKTVREQMRYDTPRLVVEAGKPLEIIFENPDFMPHNLVLVQPGARQAVAEAVQTHKPDQFDNRGRAYVPANDPKVLAATRLVEAGQGEKLQFTAPTKEGEYEYVCTFPGHSTIMWGTLVVVKDVEAYLQTGR